jgi:hypothetical protein
MTEQIVQVVQSTSNLLQLMEQSSPAQVSAPYHHLLLLPSTLLILFHELLCTLRICVIFIQVVLEKRRKGEGAME